MVDALGSKMLGFCSVFNPLELDWFSSFVLCQLSSSESSLLEGEAAENIGKSDCNCFPSVFFRESILGNLEQLSEDNDESMDTVLLSL